TPVDGPKTPDIEEFSAHQHLWSVGDDALAADGAGDGHLAERGQLAAGRDRERVDDAFAAGLDVEELADRGGVDRAGRGRRVAERRRRRAAGAEGGDGAGARVREEE